MRLPAPLLTPRLLLRSLLPEDVDGPYAGWMADDDLLRHTEARFAPRDCDSLREFVAAMDRHPDVLFLAIVLRRGERHIGNIKLGPISRPHRRGDIGLIIGERDCWGRGYATEAIAALAAHALGPLGLAKVTAGCYADNLGSARAFLKAGFSREGIRLGHYTTAEGGRTDEWLFGKVADA